MNVCLIKKNYWGNLRVPSMVLFSYSCFSFLHPRSDQIITLRLPKQLIFGYALLFEVSDPENALKQLHWLGLWLFVPMTFVFWDKKYCCIPDLSLCAWTAEKKSCTCHLTPKRHILLTDLSKHSYVATKNINADICQIITKTVFTMNPETWSCPHTHYPVTPQLQNPCWHTCPWLQQVYCPPYPQHCWPYGHGSS